ncbi:MAG: hypothetical protein QM752_05085 [Gammaproteobacteria bacterium]
MSKTVSKDELEYQFTDEQMQAEAAVTVDVQPESVSEQPAKKKLFSLSRKKIIYGIVGFVVVGGIFQFISAREKTAVEGSQVEVEKAAQERQQQKQAQVIEHPKVTVTPQVKAPELDDAPTLLQKTNALSVPSERSYAPEVKHMQQGLVQVNQSVDSLQKTIANLAASVENLSGQVQHLQAEQTAVKQAALAAAPGYSVKALITGRAWLQADGSDDLITLKVGDNLPGYGKITGIDPNAGTVATSAGPVFTYGPNDS